MNRILLFARSKEDYFQENGTKLYLPRPEWFCTTFWIAQYGTNEKVESEEVVNEVGNILNDMNITDGTNDRVVQQPLWLSSSSSSSSSSLSLQYPVLYMKSLSSNNTGSNNDEGSGYNCWDIQHGAGVSKSNSTSLSNQSCRSVVSLLQLYISKQNSSNSYNWKCEVFGNDNDTILHLAIKENNTIAALQIARIEYETFCFFVANEGRTVQQQHHHHQHITITETLLEKVNGKGMTPFILAARMGNIEVVKLLLQYDINVRATTKKGTTAIFQAAHFGHDPILDIILQHLKGTTKFTPKTFFESRCIDMCNANKITPLMRAAQEGHYKTVQVLLKYGANNSTGIFQNQQVTALMLAAQRGHVKICKLLMQQSPNGMLDFMTLKNSTALTLACKQGHVQVVQLLVAEGCQLHHRNQRNCTLHQIIIRRIQKNIINNDNNNNIDNVNVVPVPIDAQLQHNNIHCHGNDDYMDDIDDNDDDVDEGDDDDDEESNTNILSLHINQKLLYLLNPIVQYELIESLSRNKRSYEIIKFYKLLHQPNRANIQDYSSPDDLGIDLHAMIKMMNASHTSGLPDLSVQCLIRTMMLPASLVQMIALFIPLPRQWHVKIDHSYQLTETNPNISMIIAFDIIDEILEDTGFLVACKLVFIPPPSPYTTWFDWKHSATTTKQSEQWEYGNGIINNDTNNAEGGFGTPIFSEIPMPYDSNHPTMIELRRQVGYLSLLAQYKKQLIPIMTEPPYNLSVDMLQRLISCASTVDVCRRCILPRLLQQQHYPSTTTMDQNHPYKVTFDPNLVRKIILLVDEFAEFSEFPYDTEL